MRDRKLTEYTAADWLAALASEERRLCAIQWALSMLIAACGFTDVLVIILHHETHPSSLFTGFQLGVDAFLLVSAVLFTPPFARLAYRSRLSRNYMKLLHERIETTELSSRILAGTITGNEACLAIPRPIRWLARPLRQPAPPSVIRRIAAFAEGYTDGNWTMQVFRSFVLVAALFACAAGFNIGIYQLTPQDWMPVEINAERFYAGLSFIIAIGIGVPLIFLCSWRPTATYTVLPILRHKWAAVLQDYVVKT